MTDFEKTYQNYNPRQAALDEARALLRTYREGELSEVEDNILPQRTGFVELEPELTVLQGGTPWLRLRISDGGRSYVVKSLEELLSHIENNQVVSYGK